MVDQVKKTFKRDAYLYIAGDEVSDNVYIIEEGEVELKSSNEYMNRQRRVVGKGDIIGFISTLSRRPRMESAIALCDCRIAELSRENFISLLHKNRDIAVRVVNIFADELRKYNELIFSLTAMKNFSSDEVRLFELGKYYLDNKQYDFAHYVFNRFSSLYKDSSMQEQSAAYVEQIVKSGVPITLDVQHDDTCLLYNDRQMIFCEHEPGNELYVIKQGKVDIIKNKDGVDILLSVLKEGDIFGELAIASDKPRNATVVSHGPSQLLPVDRETLFSLFESSPEIVNRILVAISQRLWFTYIRADLRIYKRPITKLYVFLENKLLEERVSLKSDRSYTFDFGIDDLFLMTDLSQEKMGKSMDDLLMDQNLSFRFGQVIVDNIYELSARAKFYRNKDHLAASEKGVVTESKRESNEKKNPRAQVQDQGRWRPVNDSDLGETGQ